ncbi:MAG: VOC family protein [Promethearchaeota archaeon]
MENLKIDFGKLKIDQLGFIYKDIVKQAKIMENIFGFSKFIFGNPSTSNIQYRGRKSQITRQLAFSRLKSTQIEFIKWINGDCLFKEFLDQGKEGLHHIAFYIENTDYYIKEFEKSGIGVLQAGESFNTRVTYMDTEKVFGFFVELLEKTGRKKKKE